MLRMSSQLAADSVALSVLHSRGGTIGAERTVPHGARGPDGPEPTPTSIVAAAQEALRVAPGFVRAGGAGRTHSCWLVGDGSRRSVFMARRFTMGTWTALADRGNATLHCSPPATSCQRALRAKLRAKAQTQIVSLPAGIPDPEFITLGYAPSGRLHRGTCPSPGRPLHTTAEFLALAARPAGPHSFAFVGRGTLAKGVAGNSTVVPDSKRGKAHSRHGATDGTNGSEEAHRPRPLPANRTSSGTCPASPRPVAPRRYVGGLHAAGRASALIRTPESFSGRYDAQHPTPGPHLLRSRRGAGEGRVT